MNKNIELIKEEVYNSVDTEVHINEVLENENNLTMNLCVKNKKEADKLYQFFVEKKAKKNENSRINFFKVDNFPDGIFISFKEDQRVEVHICEMKKKPANKIFQLSRQLYAGYVHCKLLLKLLDYEDDSISYYYHVFMIEDKNKSAEYNRIPNLPKKVIPGEPIVEESEYEKWLNDKVGFQEKGYQYNFKVKKYKMKKTEETEETEYYQYAISF